jgi:hypothetical protein
MLALLLIPLVKTLAGNSPLLKITQSGFPKAKTTRGIKYEQQSVSHENQRRLQKGLLLSSSREGRMSIFHMNKA